MDAATTIAGSATARCISMLQGNGMPGDLLLEQIGHSNLKTTSGYTHFDDAFRERRARLQGRFSQEDGPNGLKFPDLPSQDV